MTGSGSTEVFSLVVSVVVVVASAVVGIDSPQEKRRKRGRTKSSEDLCFMFLLLNEKHFTKKRHCFNMNVKSA
jgi:hypothetical protein